MNGLQRGLVVLETLALNGCEMGVSELARSIKTDKSAVFRSLATLASAGYVVQDPETKKYRPTSRLVALGSAVLGKIDLRETARPFLTRLVELTGYTSHLASLAEGRPEEVVYLDQATRSSAAIMVNIRVGRVAPSHCSATGKAILAFLPADQLSRLVGEFPSYTPRTLTSGAALRFHLEAVRALGYAVDDEEYREGIRCLAAPVLDHTGGVVAAVGLSGPATDLQLEHIPRLARIVIEQADELSTALGYAGRPGADTLVIASSGR